MAHHREGRLQGHGVLGQCRQLADALRQELFDVFPTEGLPRIPGQHVLKAQKVGRLLVHQLTALASQIPDGPLCLRIDVARGEDPSTQKMGQPAGIGVVIGVRQAVVLLNRSGIGHMHAGAGFHQPIDQPLPSERRLHHDPLQLSAIGGELVEHVPEFIR